MKRSWLEVIGFMIFVLVFIVPLLQATDIQDMNKTSFGYEAGNRGNHGSYFGYWAGHLNMETSDPYAGFGNSFFGDCAGCSNTTGSFNSFFGSYAGSENIGSHNSFFGYLAGAANTDGYFNSFFGEQAGAFNLSGHANSFFGEQAGYSNTYGYSNSFFGNSAGWSNTTGFFNSFFGQAAGWSNTDGHRNSFFGLDAGRSNQHGYANSFFGESAGFANISGNNNAFFGQGAGYNNINNNNTFVGAAAGFSNTNGGANSFFGEQAGYSNTYGYSNSFFGRNAGQSNQDGYANAFFGESAGHDHLSGRYNSFFGYGAGHGSTTESNNSFFGAITNLAAGVTNATAIGYRAVVTRSNSLVLGGVNGVNGATAETNIGIGITNPDRQLTVEGTQAVGRLRRYYGTTDPFTRTYAPTFLLERSRGTQASPANIQPGDYLGKVQFRGVVGSAAIEYGAMAFIATDTSQNGRFSFLDRDIATERMVILNTGNVGINTTAPLERLHVVGNVRIDGDLIWTDPGASVPDYVFDPKFKLMGIDELKKFITEEKHLPNIPAASEIKDKGLNMSEFQMKLLQKIEELTLYIVQKDEEIASLKLQNSNLDARLAVLEQVKGHLAEK